MNVSRTLSVCSLTVMVLALAGCAGSGSAAGESATGQEAQPAAAFADTRPVSSDNLRLHINGMGCPQCVTNIDLQLAKLRGVKSTRVNLSNGTVDVALFSKERPSPAQINRAIGGDFTLVKIEELGNGELQ